MTKTSVNRIKYEGPRNHNDILAKVRTDIYETGYGISIETLSFIVSSFFSNEGMFRDIEKRKTLIDIYFGEFRKPTNRILRYDKTSIRKIKIKAARAYLKQAHINGRKFRQYKILRRYHRWINKRIIRNNSYISFEKFLIMYKLKWPTELKPITRELVEGVLYKFNDQGKVIYNKGSKIYKYYHFMKRLEKAKQESLNQH